ARSKMLCTKSPPCVCLPGYMKASIRAKVEHPFRIIKRQFGFVKARYKGLLKNDNQLAMLFTLANLFRADQMIRQWERSH
ncbi:TPA: transposase, partial [Escherichia coli]|nr:transposase [Escherichia coli]